jgi:chromosome segregation ATPase
MNLPKNYTVDWQAKAAKLFQAEIAKLKHCLEKTSASHQQSLKQRQTLKKKYRQGKALLESLSTKLSNLNDPTAASLNEEYAAQQQLLNVLHCQLKKLTVNQYVLSFNKLSLTNRLEHIEQAQALFLKESSAQAREFKNYDAVYNTLQQSDRDFPLLALSDDSLEIELPESVV